MSKITTHILDTSRGRPAAGVNVVLYYCLDDQWDEVAAGKTNADGRILDWTAADVIPDKGIFKMSFATRAYFAGVKALSFYPLVEVHFEIGEEGHYHIPLLLSPYGYSTYRGS